MPLQSDGRLGLPSLLRARMVFWTSTVPPKCVDRGERASVMGSIATNSAPSLLLMPIVCCLSVYLKFPPFPPHATGPHRVDE